MMLGGWQDLVWIAIVGFDACLMVIVIVAGVLAWRCKVGTAAILLISGGILSILGSGVGTYLQFQFRSIGWSGPADAEFLEKVIWATYGVGVLGHLLEVVGLLLVVLALRSLWRRTSQLAALNPGAPSPPWFPPH